jgi:hypothetical protein
LGGGEEINGGEHGNWRGIIAPRLTAIDKRNQIELRGKGIGIAPGAEDRREPGLDPIINI